MNGMFFAARGTGLMRIGPRPHARLVGALKSPPIGLGEADEFAQAFYFCDGSHNETFLK